MMKMLSRFARKSRVGEGVHLMTNSKENWVEVSKLQGEKFYFLHCCFVIYFKSWMYPSHKQAFQVSGI